MTDKNNEIKLAGGDDTLAANEQAGVYTATAANNIDIRTTEDTDSDSGLVRSIEIHPWVKYMKVGETFPFITTIWPEDAKEQSVDWSSGNSSIVTVDSLGVATAEGEGHTFVFATAKDGSGVQGNAAIYVTADDSGEYPGSNPEPDTDIPTTEEPPTNHRSVEISPWFCVLSEGETAKLTAALVENGEASTEHEFEWYSYEPSVATVDADGNVTAISKGKIFVSATVQDGSGLIGYATIKVNAPKEEESPNSAGEVNQSDPVDMSTGAQTLSNTLMKLFGGQGIALTAKYNSTQLSEGELGIGWHHNFEKRVVVSDNEARVYSSPSSFSKYTADESGTTFTCTTAGKTGYVLTVDCCCEYPYILNCNFERTEYYDMQGKLAKIVDRHGFETYVIYDCCMTQIVDAVHGFSIFLEKNSEGKITRVYDDQTRETTLTYENECLTSICDVNGKTLTFTYDDEGRVLTATDSTGVRYLENTYDSEGRVATQKDGTGSPATVFEYGENGARTATNRNGDKNYRVFNEQGLLTSFKDENGKTKTYTYDENCNITEETDALGNTVTTVYNSFNKPTQKTDKNGNTTKFEYDAVGNLKKIIYPNNAEETFLYNSRNQVTEHTDLRGTKTTYTYNEDGRLTSKKIGDRSPATYVYENGFLVSETDARGKTIRYTYNEIGQMTVKEDDEGRQTKYEYDLAGNITKITDPNNKSISYEYDGNYQKKFSTDANGNKTEYTYNGNMKNTLVKLPDGNCVEYVYDNEDRVVKVIDQEGNEFETTYDKVGRPISKKDPAGHETFYEYDDVGNVVKTTNAKGAHTYNTYDAAGNVVETKDNDGNITRFEYDKMSRVVRKENALSGTTLYEYSLAGDLEKETDAMGNTKTYTYDAYGNRTQVEDARGNKTKYTYDEHNNLLTVTDALDNVTWYTYDYRNLLVSVKNHKGYTITHVYDSLGRRISTTDGRNNTTTTTYDANGNVIKVVDAMGNTVSETEYNCLNLPATVKDAFANATTYAYNNLGKLDCVTEVLSNTKHYRYDNRGLNTSVIDALGNSSTATYDALGNITEVEGPNGAKTTYTYDLQGRKISETTSSGGTVQYGYTAMNLKSKVTNARGQNKKFFYDKLGRITGYISDEDSASYTYDENSNLLTATDKNGTVTREYDALNRVTKYTDTFGNTIQYNYDAVGNLIKLTYPDNTEVTYTYDENNNLTTVKDWFGRTTTYTYDKNNKLLETYYPNGMYNTKGYDEAQRLIHNVTMTPGCYEVISGTSMEYDKLGRISTEHAIEKSEYTCYTYDKLSRVTKKERYCDEDCTELLGAETYSYDVAGNIKTSVVNNQTKNFLYDTNNRITSYNGGTPSYDADGNMTSAYINGQTTSFVFDSANRLMSAGENTYTYDVQNIRIRKTHGDEETTFVYNTNARLSQLLVEKKGNTITKYVYGHGLICSYTGDESTLKVYHHDYRGSTVAITDSMGEVTDTFEYDIYGKLISRTGTTETPFMYNGRDGVYSDENGLIYMRARYYSPELRRFVNADILHGSISDSTSLNRYSYVNGNPVSFVDPLGLSAEHEGVASNWEEDIYSYLIGVIDFICPGSSNRANDVMNDPSLYNIVNWLTLGALDTINGSASNWGNDIYGYLIGVVDLICPGSSNRANDMMNDPSLYNIGNWLTIGAFDTIKGAFAPEKPLSLQHWLDSLATVLMVMPAVDAISRAVHVPTPSPSVASSASQVGVISQGDARRIQNAANRTKQNITVVGSRASGTATVYSDWDYILSGNSAQRHSAASSLPRGLSGGAYDSGIDIFSSYVNGPNPTVLDRSRPYIEFSPNKKEGL